MQIPLAVIVLFLSSVGWGLTWLPLKALNEMGLDSLQLILIAFVSAAIVVSPWLFKQYASWKKQLGLMLLIGLTGGFANTSFQAAIYHGDVVRVMILFYMLPVWSVLGGRLILKEKIDRLRAIAVLLCLAGAFIILDVWQTSWSSISWIDLMALGSGFGLSMTIILFRLAQHIPLMSKVSAVFIGCSLLTGLTISLTPLTTASIPPNALIWTVLYGALWLTLITIGTQWAVTRMEAGRSAVIIVMELVTAVVSTAILTGASLDWAEITGGLMVLSAAIMEGSRPEDTPPVHAKDSLTG